MNWSMIIAFIYIFRYKKNYQNYKGFNEWSLFQQNKINNKNIEFNKLLQKWNFI